MSLHGDGVYIAHAVLGARCTIDAFGLLISSASATSSFLRSARHARRAAVMLIGSSRPLHTACAWSASARLYLSSTFAAWLNATSALRMPDAMNATRICSRLIGLNTRTSAAAASHSAACRRAPTNDAVA